MGPVLIVVLALMVAGQLAVHIDAGETRETGLTDADRVLLGEATFLGNLYSQISPKTKPSPKTKVVNSEDYLIKLKTFLRTFQTPPKLQKRGRI